MKAYDVPVKSLPGCIRLPAYQSRDASGMDVYAAQPTEPYPWRYYGGPPAIELADELLVGEGVMLERGDRLAIPIGCAFAVPVGFELQVRPRSSLARDHGITVINSPGTVDADYRGPIYVVIVNHGHSAYMFRPGDRIAQLVLQEVPRARLREVDELPPTERGSGGFGSTGR